MSPKSTLPRRRLLAGAFALPAVAAAAAAPALAAGDRDAALLQLGRQHEAARAHSEALWERANATFETALAQHPPKPEALRILPNDWNVPGIHTPARQRLAGLMDGECVARWRESFTNQPDPKWSYRDQFIARRAEVLAAWDGWVDAKERVNVACGLRDIEAQADAAEGALLELERRIFAARAHTIEGMRLKARIARAVLGEEPDGTYEDRVVRSVLADLLGKVRG